MILLRASSFCLVDKQGHGEPASIITYLQQLHFNLLVVCTRAAALWLRSVLDNGRLRYWFPGTAMSRVMESVWGGHVYDCATNVSLSKIGFGLVLYLTINFRYARITRLGIRSLQIDDWLMVLAGVCGFINVS